LTVFEKLEANYPAKCVYKIAAKSIATRLKKVLPHLINNDQTGFLKCRFLGENIRLINSVMDYAEKQNIPDLLLFVDFEKPSILWNEPSSRKHSLSTTSEPLLKVGSN